MASGRLVHVCQRCCNPLQLHQDFEKLQKSEILDLVDALGSEKREEEESSLTLVPVRTTGSDHPRYVVPPNSKSVTDTEALAALHSSSESSFGLDLRFKVNAYLFDILSGRTDVDHPLCQDCADALLASKQQCLDFQKEELDCLQTYLKYLDRKAERAERKLKKPNNNNSSSLRLDDADDADDINSERWLSCTDSCSSAPVIGEDVATKEVACDVDCQLSDDSCDSQSASSSDEDCEPTTKRPSLAEQKAMVTQLQNTLKTLLVESEQLDKQLASETARLEQRSKQLYKATTEYNERKQTLLEAEEEFLALESRVQHAQKHLVRLQCTNVLNITFPIWYDGHIGIINGLHLGRLSNRPIAWDEINAAWGQCAILVQCIAKKLHYTFQDYRVIPMGNQSKVRKLSQSKEYPLYYSTPGMVFSTKNFDTGMVCFLNCVHEVQQQLPHGSPHTPYQIKEQGEIEDMQDGRSYSIKLSGNSEEDWTKALKMMLIILKWTICGLSIRSAPGPSTANQ